LECIPERDLNSTLALKQQLQAGVVLSSISNEDRRNGKEGESLLGLGGNLGFLMAVRI
jgi:hypothetical protein